MTYSWAESTPEIKEFVFSILNKTKEILCDNFIGFYLHGSLAMGGFNPASSDIDILVATERSIEIETRKRLAKLFLTYSNNPFPIEISIINREQLKKFEHPSPYDFHFSEFWRARYEEDLSVGTCKHLNREIRRDPDLAAHIMITTHRGICIEGKSIGEVFPSIPHSYYISSIMEDFNDCLENIFENPVYCTLNFIRVYWYLSEGIISSKQEAGTWGFSSLPKEMTRTLKKVNHNYSHKYDFYDFKEEELLAIRDYIASKVQKLINYHNTNREGDKINECIKKVKR
ncbi:nucleotidyltransferase domain-containing protein [Bacillus sp. FJAT-27245]|uniref:nucleotidyltransferase domain-containing protein n=1 Tax=Bacillus sp. FJAT-27245 TaxID=1684144 RepID=UPI0006A76B81|nr:nucleotidyltransferase domain-containing protein [Bacillus sp. FJAT-27245]